MRCEATSEPNAGERQDIEVLGRSAVRQGQTHPAQGSIKVPPSEVQFHYPILVALAAINLPRQPNPLSTWQYRPLPERLRSVGRSHMPLRHIHIHPTKPKSLAECFPT
jgi:hypothetical protein